MHYLLLLVILFLPHLLHGVKNPPVPQKYAHWLNEEINYLITSDERSLFLNLKSDQERDTFITTFWQARNPNPDPAVNPVKDEHYRRLEYANEHFGTPGYNDGWDTDRGMAYITLGEPKQRQRYPETKELHPIEIWFYQSTSRALLPYFYLMFFKQSPAEEYRLYSPYTDRPQKLINSTNAVNNDKAAIKLIQRDIDTEAAHVALSLIPGEPVDMAGGSPTLESDVLLNNIRNFRNLPENRELLSMRRAQERVTSSVFLGRDEAELQLAVFRDKQERMTLNYLLRYRQPDATLIGHLADGRTGYSMTLRTTVFTAAGKTAYEDEQKLTGALTDAQGETARRKSFGAEGRLPLAPGEYKLATTLTNDLTHVAVRQVSKVTVPDPEHSGWGTSNVVAFTAQPLAATSSVLPFTIEGLRFAPKGVQSVSVHAGEKLRLLFQLWSRPAEAATLQSSKIRVSYLFGTVQGSSGSAALISGGSGSGSSDSGSAGSGSSGQGNAKEESEEVDGSGFDPSGVFLTGHTLSSEGERPGSYRLVITATDEKSGAKAYATMNLRIVDASEPTDLWTAYDAAGAGARTEAEDDYKRGLCALAFDQKAEGKRWFQRSTSEDPQYTQPVARLADLYAADGEYKPLAELSRDAALTHELDEKTLLLMADANNKVGDLKRATELLEAGLKSRPPSANVYLALAKLYDQAGNVSKAQHYRQQARNF